MKLTIWIVTTCVPGDTVPCLPAAFATLDEANAYADKMLREEWEINCPGEEDETTLPYPGDWREAMDKIAEVRNGEDGDAEKWGEWEITPHEIEVPANG